MKYCAKLLKTLVLATSIGSLYPALSQTQADSIIVQRTFEFIRSHADDLLYDLERNALYCNILWGSLSQLGLTELEYDGGYPYRFAKHVSQTTQFPKKALRKKVRGSVRVEFYIDTLGSLILRDIYFQQYKSMVNEIVPEITDSLCWEIEQSVRQCVENSQKWMPISDLAGNKYPCRCNMSVEIGKNRLNPDIYIEILLKEKYMPLIDDETGEFKPLRLFLRKIYDEKREPDMRKMSPQEAEQQMEYEKKIFKAAGTL